MMKNIKVELMKLWCRRGVHIGFLGILALFVLMAIGYLNFKSKRLDGVVDHAGPELVQIASGLSFAVTTTIMGMQFLVPLFVGLIAGTQIAGEAKEGTLRAVLTKVPYRAKA